MSGPARDWDGTTLGRYLRETGTKSSWLAQRVGVTDSKVCRWARGNTGMSEADREKVLEVLRERAALSLDDLFDDQSVKWAQPDRVTPRHRTRLPESPYERMLADQRTGIVERPLADVVTDIAGVTA